MSLNKLKSIFKSSKPKTDVTDYLRLNLKGQQVKSNQTFDENTFKESLQNANIPHMFNTTTRLRIWMYLALFGVYCYGLSKLMLYRLKSDDLEIMEREVKEEWEIKRKIKEINDLSDKEMNEKRKV